MRSVVTIKINFRGGIISPGELYKILVAVSMAGIYDVRFGLRQQLLIDVPDEMLGVLTDQMDQLDVFYECGKDEFPNITSSYAAEEVFIHNTWLGEGVYKDIFDNIDFTPRLKVNISDTNQSFTPMLTGNINWVASSTVQHFWHLFVRFPKTNVVYEWKEMTYTNDIARLSQEIEQVILHYRSEFYDNVSANGHSLFQKIAVEKFITKPAVSPAVLPAFNLPYYEGLNRYNDKYWLGIYRRDELFSVAFLKDLCLLCLSTKIGQICSTPWKSVIVKSIEEKDKAAWNRLLERHQINMRHAANELNFQVEDNCGEGLQLKNYLVKRLSNEDTRTFGVCIGIKTRKKSEVFSSILVRRKSLLSFFGYEMFHLYDILCAHDFNPNQRTGFVFSRNNPKFLLGEQLRRSILAFYNNRNDKHLITDRQLFVQKEGLKKKREVESSQPEHVYQCKHCLTVCDFADVAAHEDVDVRFQQLPEDYTCNLCESPKTAMMKVEKRSLGLQPI